MYGFWPGPGVKLLAGAGAGVYPGEVPNFGRGREGPGVVILAGAGAPVDHWLTHAVSLCMKSTDQSLQ